MYAPPDWAAPINFDEEIAAIPAHATVRGMFLQFLVESLGARAAEQLQVPRYIAFKSYPMRDYVSLLARGSRIVFPGVAPAEAVRRLGRVVYPNYARTMTGTAVFAVAGRDFRRIVELCPRAYQIGMTPGDVKVRSISDGHAFVELREIWNLPEFHQVGVWEGAMEVCGVTGTIATHRLRHGAVDFDVRWR